DRTDEPDATDRTDATDGPDTPEQTDATDGPDTPERPDAIVEADVVPPAPHIRIRTSDVNGRPVDTFGPIVDAMFHQTCQVMIGPWSLPPSGMDAAPPTIEAVDNLDDVDSRWTFTPAGQVTATGWAAMVNPSESCTYTPEMPFGPGHAGVDDGLLHWLTPVELSTKTWVAVTVQDDPEYRSTFHR
ncbi:MAG: hypothetical protein WBV89_06675, partial [Ilumatobacter sp.]